MATDSATRDRRIHAERSLRSRTDGDGDGDGDGDDVR